MEDFVTISLDSNQCDICEHETGEELIPCVLNDRCLRQNCDSEQEGQSHGNFKRVHRGCLEKWESVMRNSLKPLGQRPKRTLKDKIMDSMNSNGGKCEERLVEMLIPTKQQQVQSESETGKTTHTPHCLRQFEDKNHGNNDKYVSFLVDETYSVKRVDGSRKVRVHSVDMETTEFDVEDHVKIRPSEKYTIQQLEKLSLQELHDTVTNYKIQVTEASRELVNELQERDSMLQQGETLQVTIAQLVNLQHQSRTKSSLKS